MRQLVGPLGLATNARTAKSRPDVTSLMTHATRYAALPRASAWTSAVVSGFFDHAPSDLTHVFALDRDHGVGQLRDDLLLLFLAENVFDDSDLNERH
jgi:hypothetical protein